MKQNKPNVVLIFIDDMGYRDLACSGSTFYETPNIDKLRENGIMFEESYAACPVCSPSRASMMTGKYPAHVGITDWIDDSGKAHPQKGKVIEPPYLKHLETGEKTIATHLKSVGYDTWHVGKWHLGKDEYFPQYFGFDVNIAGCQFGHPLHGFFSPYNIPTISDGPEGEYLTDRITDEAISLINSSTDKPFFLNLCHYAVHTPIQAKAEDIEYFKKKAKRMRIDKIEPFVEGDNYKTDYNSHLRTKHRVIQSDPAYAAMVYNLDVNIGKLIDALEINGKLDNTLIIFTSDNGGLSTAEGSPTCNFPASEGKGWMSEGGLRVPLIMYHKELIASGVMSKTPTTTPDVFSTILDIAGIEQEKHIDGMSLKEAFNGKKLEDRPMFWHYPHYGNQGGEPSGAVRYGNYKLIEYFEDGRTELFDIVADVSECNEISKEKPETAKMLYDLLKVWQKETRVLFPIEI